MIANEQNGPWVYFFTGWLNILLIIMVIASIAYSFWANMIVPRRKSRAGAKAEG
jgi:putative tricarboxylic transport membrane protein